MKTKKPYLIAIASAVLLSGCASYQAATLSSLSPEFLPAAQESAKKLAVVAKAFNRSDCRKYLDRDVIDEGYQPVQLAIYNNTNKTYLFSLNGVSLPNAPSEEVADKVHTSTVGRILAYGIPAVVFPVLLIPLGIPAVVDGIKSSNANERLDNDYAAKEAKEQILYPLSKINSLIFVPVESFKETFTISLIDKETNQPELVTVTSR